MCVGGGVGVGGVCGCVGESVRYRHTRAMIECVCVCVCVGGSVRYRHTCGMMECVGVYVDRG